eukprot:TRINITY_DN9779_c1_g4_i1.p1 TRINITY_DN9779_c1_g4~~TRINITY_DN9779_c1_g4_i1.p1  ORF type:complete len:465 (+),score=84.77 TRINITY_DN9779_c1_g4_i1:57-1451(+)
MQRHVARIAVRCARAPPYSTFLWVGRRWQGSKAGDGESRPAAPIDSAPLKDGPAIIEDGASECGAPSPWNKKLMKNLFVMTGCQFLTNISFGVIIPVIPQFAAELGVGAFGAGAIISAPAVARIFVNIPLGRAADRYGRKPLMIIGTLVGAVAACFTAYAHTIFTVVLARLLSGAGTAASMTGTTAYMADITTKIPGHRAKVLGGTQAVVTAAFVAGPAIGGFLAEVSGPRTAFLVVGGAMALSSVGFRSLPETKPPAAAAAAEGEERSVWTMLQKNRDQQGIVVMTSALFAGYAAQMVLLPLQAAATLGASTGEIGLLFSASSCAGLLGAPLGGYCSDRFGRRATILPAAALCSVAPALLSFSHSYPTVLVAMLAWGCGSSLMHPGLMALAADKAPPEERGLALSLSRQAGDVVFFLVPLTLGFVADAVSVGASLWLTSAYYVASAAYFYLRVSPDAQTAKDA